MKVIISADKHTRGDSPYKEAIQKLFHHLSEMSWNVEENIFIDLGDFYHRARPFPYEYEMGHDFFSSLRCRRKILLAGNHDYDDSGERLQFSLDAMRKDPGIEIVDTPKVETFENLTLHFLPWAYSFDGESRKTFYENTYKERQKNISADYLLYHFPDETMQFGKKSRGIDLSGYSGKRIGGDIHIESTNYLGVPIPTRKDEAGQSGKILVIDCDTKVVEEIKIPRFLDFFSIIYGEPARTNPEGLAINYITQAPSFEQAEEKYSDACIGGITLKAYSSSDPSSQENREEKEDQKDYIEDFFSEKKINERVQSIMRAAIRVPQTM